MEWLHWLSLHAPFFFWMLAWFGPGWCCPPVCALSGPIDCVSCVDGGSSEYEVVIAGMTTVAHSVGACNNCVKLNATWIMPVISNPQCAWRYTFTTAERELLIRIPIRQPNGTFIQTCSNPFNTSFTLDFKQPGTPDVRMEVLLAVDAQNNIGTEYKEYHRWEFFSPDPDNKYDCCIIDQAFAYQGTTMTPSSHPATCEGPPTCVVTHLDCT